ncbi:MAG: cation diffusion facilitator family transporter [Alphaproteobacteria bacterium]|nr:cation diffusion facilitator family transporter [Alphaproteobacteria bacterium]
MRRVAVAAVSTAAGLALLKAIAFILTNSMAVMASLADSGLDVFASFINLLAVRAALTPADHEHRFGHGKAEPLAGLAQSAFIAGSATFLVIESIERIITPRPVEHGAIGLWVMAISIVATIVLVTAQQVVVQRTGSIAIGADRMHYVSDVLVNLGVIFGIVMATEFGITIADPLVGLLVAVVLAIGVVHVFRQSYDQLMDHELPDADRERIKNIILTHAGVFDMHDLRTRAAGLRSFIQFHIELDPALSLYAAHALSDAVEADIRKEYPSAEIIIHQDPEGFEAPEDLAKS